MEACYDRDSSFWLKRFLNDRTPQPKIVGTPILCCDIFRGIRKTWDCSSDSDFIFIQNHVWVRHRAPQARSLTKKKGCPFTVACLNGRRKCDTAPLYILCRQCYRMTHKITISHPLGWSITPPRLVYHTPSAGLSHPLRLVPPTAGRESISKRSPPQPAIFVVRAPPLPRYMFRRKSARKFIPRGGGVLSSYVKCVLYLRYTLLLHVVDSVQYSS